MKSCLYVIAFLLLSVMTYGQIDTVFTNEVTETIILEETVIKAYKADKLTPVTFKDLSKTEIDFFNHGQEPSGILSGTPSINSYSDAGNYQGYSYFRLRGMDQTRVNMTLDGIPLNEPEDQGVYFSNYPDFFNSIHSLQIQRGVGTTSNGVASYAGSINFQSPNLLLEKYTEFGINYGSFNTYRVYGEHNSGINNEKAIYARLSSSASDGYKYHSSNKSSSAFVSLGLFKPSHKLKFTGFSGTQKNQLAWIGVPLETIETEPRTNGNSDENDRFSQMLMSLQHTYTFNRGANLNSTVYYSFLDGNYDFDLNNFLGFPSDDEMYNYHFKHHFMGAFTNLNWNLQKLSINGGIHMNTFNRRHTGSEKSYGRLYENFGNKNEFSSFFKLSYTIDKIVAFTDIQYRYSDFRYKGSVDFEKINWQFLNPKIGINFFITENSNFYYNFGISGREPTRNDMFNGEDDLPSDENGHAIFNDVNPEFVRNHEFGFKTQKKSWHIIANAYRMDFNNEIILNGQFGPNGLPLHSNVARSYRSGFELDMKLKVFNDFYCSSNSSLSFNQISENNIKFKPILTPEFIVNNIIGYRSKKLESGIVFKYQSRSFVDFENKYRVPSFYTIDLLGSYTFKSFSFRSGIINLTNQTIISNGYIGLDGMPLFFVQAPINFNAGAIWKF